MRGGYLHNQIILIRLAKAFEAVGGRTQFEASVRMGTQWGFVDLVVLIDEVLIAVEAENTARRIDGDLKKAAALGADQLWIVTPNRRVAQSVCRQRQRLAGTAFEGQVFVLPLGVALQRVTDCFSNFSGS